MGLVDVNPAALGEAGDWLGLPEHGRFDDVGEAFAAVEADFCCIVTPPVFHRYAVELACALVVMSMTNGAFASYEGNYLAAGKTHSWHGEYYRVECEGGAAVLDRDHVVRIEERSAAGTPQTREVPAVDVTWEGHQAIAAQFLDWLDGGPAPVTSLEDNLQATAMLFGAIQAAETGMTVDVQEVVGEIAGMGESREDAWNPRDELP